MEDTFDKVCEVFGIGKLNKYRECLIKYVVVKEKNTFVNFPTGFFASC